MSICKHKKRVYVQEANLMAGRWLYEALQKSGITQAELGRRSGKQHTHISRVVNSRTDPLFGTLMEMIEACGIELVVEFRNKKSTSV